MNDLRNQEAEAQLTEDDLNALAEGISRVLQWCMLDLLEDRNSTAAMKIIEGSVTESEKEQIRADVLQLQTLIASFVRKCDLQLSKKNLRRILASDVSQV